MPARRARRQGRAPRPAQTGARPRTGSTRGGARPGAGRPARGPRPSEPHTIRPALSPRHPVQVTARVVPGLGRLPRRARYRAVRRAVHTALARTDFRIIELEVRSGEIALIVEAHDRTALARGMQGFQIAAARYLNGAARRRGALFPDRYRARALANRRAVRRAIAALPGRVRTCSPLTWLLRIDGGGRTGPRWDPDPAILGPPG